jgi:hypothetical protein
MRWLGGIYSPPTTSIVVGEATGNGRTGQSGAPPDRHCSVSGAPPRHPIVRVQSRVDRWSFVLLRHRTVRCPSDFAGTLDSPVNYSGACLRFPESGWLTPVRSWCTGHSPVAHRTVQCANSQHTQVLCSVSN